jgi:hypothetical protein
METSRRIDNIQHGTERYSVEELREIVRRRNKRLLAAFSELEDQIRIIGDPQTPAIIFNNELVLSVYVQNFDLHFTDAPVRGKKLRKEKLVDGFRLLRSEIIDYIKSTEHRKVYKIQFFGSELFLAGWNFKDRERQKGKYPVFARHNPKLYFTKEKAIEIVADLLKIHYDCKIV